MAFVSSFPIARRQRLASISQASTSFLRRGQVWTKPREAVGCVAKISTSSPPSIPTSSAQEREIFACVNCGAVLPAALNGNSCSNCGTPYRRDVSGFVDFDPQPRRRPLSTTTFQSPFVAFLYERGWRDRFAVSGFPGPDAEARSACAFIGDDASVILDASCGTGIMTRRLASEYDRVVALDFSAAMLTEAARRESKSHKFERVRADISRMPFVTDAFDAVVAGAALHCWPSPQDALLEVHRVLRRNGAFYATTFQRDAFTPPGLLRIFPELGNSSSGQYRFFWPDELVWLCKAAGFGQVDVQVSKSFITVRCRK